MRQDNRTSIGVKTGLALLAVTLMMTGTRAFAQHETILRWFTDVPYGDPNDAPDGIDPTGTLTFDAAGNLYGTTSGGGAFGYGTVFELSPKAGGGWRERVLYSFRGYPQDGAYPETGVILDASGNIYGVTPSSPRPGTPYGVGVVFELLNNGSWHENVLYEFDDDEAHLSPGGLIFGPSGYLYGTTTSTNADHNCGTVFELGRKPGGGWDEKTLFVFDCTDGIAPYGDLIFDASGNVDGITQAGGPDSWGVAFQLTPPTAGGDWTEKALYNFSSQTGPPTGGLVLDAVGNLYGVATEAFELVTGTDGSWTYNPLCPVQGIAPVGSLIFDASGNLYGATFGAGYPPNGTVYEITP